MPPSPRPRFPLSLTAALLAAALAPGCRCTDPNDPLVQDFEGRSGLGKWPKESPGVVELSRDWKADGERSLRIDPGLLGTVASLARHDFRGYDALRLHVHNPSDRLAAIGFELVDEHDSLRDRHQSAFGAPPGDSVIDLDLSGDLWRGEENRPFRGPTSTPIDLAEITRLGFTNRGDKPIFLDGLTLVRSPLAVPPGAVAFDFGKRGSRVMGKTTGVFEDTVFTADKEFGFLPSSAKPTFLRNTMSYPTPLLGDGLAWGDAGFVVTLNGGPYLGWIAFERGGFWEDEASGYSLAQLLDGGTVIHEHTFSPAGPHFQFEDVEVTRMADVESRLVWPAHAVHRFSFNAIPGQNTLSLVVRDPRGLPLRVAGLFLAPDTTEGKAFIDAQEERQRQSLRRAFAASDHARRAATVVAQDRPLTVERRPTGEVAHPEDGPDASTAPAQDQPISAVTGHHAYAQLALHAPADVTLSIIATPPANSPVSGPTIGLGSYGPKRPYTGGEAWIETHYYRPLTAAETVTVGPALSRSLVLDFAVPDGAPPGPVTFSLRFARGAEVLAEIPLTLDVFAVKLPPIPIATGIFMSALPFGPEVVGEARWWELQEALLSMEGEAGLTTPTGGPGLDFAMHEAGEGYSFAGERALRYLALAGKYGLDRAVVCYSGFLRSLKHERPDAARFQKSWSAFEGAHGLPPHYLYAYDEPATDEELADVAAYLAPFKAAGARTIGFFSSADGERYRAVLDATWAPAVSGHTLAQLKGWVGGGKPLFLYNRGTDRLSMGSDLYQMIRLGVTGRLEWTGVYTQGFAFDDLDGREPSYGLFVVHDRLGVLPTPRWLSLREGLIDARIELALERASAPLGPAPAAPAGWPQAYPADPAKWPEAALTQTRRESLRRLAAAPAPP